MPKKLTTEERLTNLILDAELIHPNKEKSGYIVITYDYENDNDVPSITYSINGNYDELLIALTTTAVDKDTFDALIRDVYLGLIVDDESENDEHRSILVDALNSIATQIQDEDKPVMISRDEARTIIDLVMNRFEIHEDS